MARRITEERLTLTILNWLEATNWVIISFDFPQSGTGMLIQPNNRTIANKNKGGFIPDIIACKADNMIFFENKNRFALEDYEKVNYLRKTKDYSNSISQLISEFKCNQTYYGIGIPLTKGNQKKDKENWSMIDFTVMVSSNWQTKVIHDPISVFDPL